MNRLYLIGALLAALALAVAQRAQLNLSRQLLDAHAAANAQLARQLTTLHDTQQQTRQQMVQMMRSQQQVQNQLADRQSEIRRLQHDVQSVRDWANQPLPADIARLLAHPAARGAGAYYTGLPAGSGLHAERGQPEKQWRLTAAD